jgi:hypothetical protein
MTSCENISSGGIGAFLVFYSYEDVGDTSVQVVAGHTDLFVVYGVGRGEDDDPNDLAIQAFVGGSDGTVFADEVVGLVKKGKAVRLRVQWDAGNNQIHFYVNDAIVFTASGLPEEIGPPLDDFKGIEAESFAATCFGGPTAEVDLKGTIDNVRIGGITPTARTGVSSNTASEARTIRQGMRVRNVWRP